MDNKKKLTIIIAVLAVVCVFAVLVFSGVLSGDGFFGEEETTEGDILSASDEYMNYIKTNGKNDLPYLSTDIENIFYTMSTEGDVKFYSFADNTFTPVDASGTYDVSVVMSEQDVSTTVTYYEKDGVISGYGLYTGKTDSFDLYPYAFFRLTNYGEDYDKAYSTSCLLLVDTTEDDFYSNEKIYEEPFIFKYSDSSCTRMLSEANRTVGMDGTKRSDYSLMNDAVIDGSVEHQLFFSGRQYAEADAKVDLLRSGGSGNNVDNVRLAQDVLGYWAKYVEDSIMYITVDESENVIIVKYDTDSEEASTVKTFDGVKRDDILVYGDYLYIISKNMLYSLLEDKEISLAYNNASSFRADMFVCNGETFVVRGYTDNRYPCIITAAVENGTVKNSYSNEFFRNVVNPVLVGDNVMFTVQENGSFGYYIF